MASEQLGVLWVGCGSVSRGWMPAVEKMPDVRVLGLVDLRREAAEALAQKHNLRDVPIFTNVASGLAATKPQAVFDLTVPSAHRQVTLAALAAGCHVLGEKPLSDALASAREMVAAAKATGKTYAVIQNRRYDPNIVGLRRMLQSGVIGPVEEVHADFYIGAHFGGFRDEMDDVLLVDMAIHTFDAARYISGADPVAVYCHSFNPKHSWYKGHASAVAVFEMSDGIVFSYRGSWCAEGLNTTWESDWRIIGAKGSVRWDGAKDVRAQAIKPDGKPGFRSEMVDVPVAPATLDHAGHAGVIREFVDCVRTGRRPQTICEDNIKSLAMVLAAVESRKTGRRIKVEW